MCAIAGVVGLPFERKTGEGMIETMLRRGPDGHGIYTDKQCMLLHTRLAIIDRIGGAQPMRRSFDNEEFIITYNGELYNTDDIRQELMSLGYSFVSRSDTEVLLYAYIHWKEECLAKLNGIFAFGIWECTRKRLFIARDRMGVKPLFYREESGGILFASEIKTILAYPGVMAILDREGIAELVLLGPGRTSGSGVLKGIKELEPGNYAIYDDAGFRTYQYWKLRDRIHTDSLQETIETVRYLVSDSINRQMVSDVPIGTFLSGGLDSSIITSICAKASAERLQTFSVDYENQEKNFVSGKFQPSSDTAFINIMTEYLHTDHHWVILDSNSLFNSLQEATCARDLPGMADVDFSLLRLCGRIKDSVTVALSGECADEIFGGYPWYRDPEIRDIDGFPWSQNLDQRIMLLNEDVMIQDPREFVRSRYLNTLQESDILPENSIQERRMKQMVNLNLRWFMQTLLDRKDRMSMYHGLEVRVPFCDHRIAEYMYAVPWEMKDLEGKEKGLLRAAVKDLLPSEILWRKKSPYPKTFDPQYTHLVETAVGLLLQDPNAPIFQIISKTAVQNIIENEHPWPWYGQLMRRPQLLAYILQIDFWLRKYKITVE